MTTQQRDSLATTDPTTAHRLGVKIFVENPAAVEPQQFVPIFHSWIQTHALENLLLIDVADYKHVPSGPGIVLVAHEANLGMDETGKGLGLYYYRKQPQAGSFAERVRDLLRNALNACRKLELEPALAGKLRFRTSEILFRINDRLQAPNDPQTQAAVKSELTNVLGDIWGTNQVKLDHRADPSTCFEVNATLPAGQTIDSLLMRLK